MKIGVLADTHLRTDLKKLEKSLGRYLSEVDLIIHVGDFISIEAVKFLCQHKKLVGVCLL